MPAETPSLEPVSTAPQASSPHSGNNPETLLPFPDSVTASRRSWLWASLPPVFMLGLSLCVRTGDFVPPSPLVAAAAGTSVSPAALAGLPASLRQGILPVSETMVVGARGIAGFASLRGTLEGASGVRGKAPMAGQIARVLVKPGQQVAVNDKVIELANDTSGPRSSSRAERGQSSAESAQIAAVNQQESLQYKMLAAQQRLAASQKRVDAAQARLASAKAIVEKLKRGENVSADEAKPARQAEAPAPKPAEATPPKELLEARRKALAEAEKSQQQVAKAADASRVAARAVTAAEDDLKRKNQKVEEMRTASDKVQKLFDSGTAKASDVDAARAGLEDAQTDVQSATARLAAARKDAARLHLAEGQAKSSVQEASKTATQSLQNLQLFADAAQKDAPAQARGEDERSNSETSSGGASLSLEAAARMVRDAIEESDAAAADARRIKASVDDYAHQVSQTKNRLDSSSQNLEAAQQRVLDETIQKGLSVVRAPANGTVLSVASVATNVSEGDTIIRIGRSDTLQVKLTDETGIWRTLKSGMVLTGRAETAPSGKAAGANGAAVPAPATQVNLRITEITPPDGMETQAVILASIEPSGRPGEPAPRLKQGTSLVCSVVKPGERRAILVPASSVITLKAGVGTVAVLREQPEAPANSVQGESLQAHHIEWREVRLGVGNGDTQEIASGLNSGERIALQPVVLQAYAKSTGASEVRLETDV